MTTTVLASAALVVQSLVAAAASCRLALVFIHQREPDRIREWLRNALPLLDQAQKLEPENPRVLWIVRNRATG